MTIAEIVRLAAEHLLDLAMEEKGVGQEEARAWTESRSLALRTSEEVAEYLYDTLRMAGASGLACRTDDDSGRPAWTGHQYRWPDGSKTVTVPSGAVTVPL